jgi:hypothetical protein
LVWDAEHAPQNVGMSHNVLARTTNDGGETVVEAITKVQSIDLVADPATTSGLYEHAGTSSAAGAIDANRPSAGGSPSLDPSHPVPLLWNEITLEDIHRHRPDLVQQVEAGLLPQVEQLQNRLDELTAREAVAQRRESILQLLQEHGLPLPEKNAVANQQIVSQRFLETLMSADDPQTMRQLVEERAALVRSARNWNGNGRNWARGPRSKDQVQVALGAVARPICSGQQFAAAIRSA